MAEDRSHSTAPHATANDLDGLLIQRGRAVVPELRLFQARRDHPRAAQAFARVVIVGLLTCSFLARLLGGGYLYCAIAAGYLTVSVGHVLVVRHWPDRFLCGAISASSRPRMRLHGHELGIGGLGFYPFSYGSWSATACARHPSPARRTVVASLRCSSRPT